MTYTQALEAAGVKPGGGQRVVMTSSFHETNSSQPLSGGAVKGDDTEKTDNEEEEPSIEDTIAQLSTHGADYLR